MEILKVENWSPSFGTGDAWTLTRAANEGLTVEDLSIMAEVVKGACKCAAGKGKKPTAYERTLASMTSRKDDCDSYFTGKKGTLKSEQTRESEFCGRLLTKGEGKSNFPARMFGGYFSAALTRRIFASDTHWRRTGVELVWHSLFLTRVVGAGLVLAGEKPWSQSHVTDTTYKECVFLVFAISSAAKSTAPLTRRTSRSKKS